MATEEFRYEITKAQGDGYNTMIYRKLDGKWRECKQMGLAFTKAGARFAAKRWIRNWAKGKYNSLKVSETMKVERKWN